MDSSCGFVWTGGAWAEVFATYTRAHRVLAIAGRIEQVDDRWRIVALQLG